MEITLKHRLIGASVILALVVIFVPMLFSKHAKKQMLAMQNIPQSPAQTLIEQPTAETATESMTAQATTPTPEEIEKAQNQVVTQPAKTEDQSPLNESVIEAPTSVEPVVTTPDTQPEIKPEIKPEITPVKDVKPVAEHPLMHSSVMHKRKIHHHFVKHIHRIKANTHHQRLMKAKAHHQAYVVQLGSFADTQHAKSLIKRLRQKGFTAFGYKSKVNNQIFTRVYIGPAVQLQKAKVMRNKLAKVMQMQGIVKQFQAARLN